MTLVSHHLWRIPCLTALAVAMIALTPETRAQHGGGHGGGGMGGFHGGGGMGGFHGGGGMGGFHGGTANGFHGGFHGGGPVFGFGFGGWPFWGGGYPYYGGYSYYYPPAYPYYYPPAAPYPAPTPYYPAPAAAPASFAVHFATNSDQLNAAAHDTVAQAAAAAAHSNVQIEVAGYADATGSASYNLDLSRRRAEHVGGALVAAGVPQQRIGLAWHGESAASGGAQPYDRRVVITIGGPPASAPFPNGAPPNAMPQPPAAPPPHLSSL